MNDYDAKLDKAVLYPYAVSILGGYIFDDKKLRFGDGEWITTSRVVGFEKDIVITKNTRYRILRFAGDVGEWIEENNIDFTTAEGQMAIRLRWF